MSLEDIVKMFTYRKWTEHEVAWYGPLRQAAQDYALAVFHKLPDCEERDTIIRNIQRISMDVNMVATMHSLED